MPRKRARGKYNRACDNCARSKKKCDVNRPCTRCVKFNLSCCDGTLARKKDSINPTNRAVPYSTSRYTSTPSEVESTAHISYNDEPKLRKISHDLSNEIISTTIDSAERTTQSGSYRIPASPKTTYTNNTLYSDGLSSSMSTRQSKKEYIVSSMTNPKTVTPNFHPAQSLSTCPSVTANQHHYTSPQIVSGMHLSHLNSTMNPDASIMTRMQRTSSDVLSQVMPRPEQYADYTTSKAEFDVPNISVYTSHAISHSSQPHEYPPMGVQTPEHNISHSHQSFDQSSGPIQMVPTHPSFYDPNSNTGIDNVTMMYQSHYNSIPHYSRGIRCLSPYNGFSTQQHGLKTSEYKASCNRLESTSSMQSVDGDSISCAVTMTSQIPHSSMRRFQSDKIESDNINPQGTSNSELYNRDTNHGISRFTLQEFQGTSFWGNVPHTNIESRETIPDLSSLPDTTYTLGQNDETGSLTGESVRSYSTQGNLFVHDIALSQFATISNVMDSSQGVSPHITRSTDTFATDDQPEAQVRSAFTDTPLSNRSLEMTTPNEMDIAKQMHPSAMEHVYPPTIQNEQQHSHIVQSFAVDSIATPPEQLVSHSSSTSPLESHSKSDSTPNIFASNSDMTGTTNFSTAQSNSVSIKSNTSLDYTNHSFSLSTTNHPWAPAEKNEKLYCMDQLMNLFPSTLPGSGRTVTDPNHPLFQLVAYTRLNMHDMPATHVCYRQFADGTRVTDLFLNNAAVEMFNMTASDLVRRSLRDDNIVYTHPDYMERRAAAAVFASRRRINRYAFSGRYLRALKQCDVTGEAVVGSFFATEIVELTYDSDGNATGGTTFFVQVKPEDDALSTDELARLRKISAQQSVSLQLLEHEAKQSMRGSITDQPIDILDSANASTKHIQTSASQAITATTPSYEDESCHGSVASTSSGSSRPAAVDAMFALSAAQAPEVVKHICNETDEIENTGAHTHQNIIFDRNQSSDKHQQFVSLSTDTSAGHAASLVKVMDSQVLRRNGPVRIVHLPPK